MTTERIAAAIKPILDEDRRADRERIAELERDRAHYASPDTQKSIADLSQQLRAQLIELDVVHRRSAEKTVTIENLNKQLDELTEKCAALVVERNQLTVENNHLHGDNKRLTDSLAMGNPYGLGLVNKTPTLRIDTDMSDPQPGKLLVVRLDGEDSYKWQEGQAPYLTRDQFVGFLVETPAVEVKRTPKVGDRVRFVDGSHHQGIIGEVLFKYDGDAFMVGQGSLKYCGKAADLEVIE